MSSTNAEPVTLPPESPSDPLAATPVADEPAASDRLQWTPTGAEIDGLWREIHAQPDPEDAPVLRHWPRLMLRLGDAPLVSGDRGAACTAWHDALNSAPTGPFGRAPDAGRDARIRFAFVGQEPPPIGESIALGGEAATWESLGGQVGIAHSFWTYCNPSRSTMVSLGEIQARHPDVVAIRPLADPGPRALHTVAAAREPPDPAGRP